MHQSKSEATPRRIVLLPTPGPRITFLAINIVAECAALMKCWNTPLIAIGHDRFETDSFPQVAPWAPSFRTWSEQASEAQREPAQAGSVARTATAARELIELLAERWPAYARPERLGLLTDGSGIGFAPENPWPFTAEWMLPHVSGSVPLTEIVPFHAQGPWAQLTSRRDSKARH